MRAFWVLGVAATVGLIVFAFVELGGGEGQGGLVGVKAAAACTEKAPACLPRVAMTDTAGGIWDSEALADKVVLVNFWATWCRPCKEEIPDLAALEARFGGDDFVVLGLLTDQPSDQELADYTETFGINYPVIRVGPELLDAFEFSGRLPVTYIYDRTGHLRQRLLGRIRRQAVEGELIELLDGSQ